MKNYLGQPRDKNDLRKLKPETIEEISKLTFNSNYQHGDGCKCPFYARVDGGSCKEGEPNYSKIGRELEISRHTVKMVLEPEFRDRRNKEHAKYRESEKGKETEKKYKESDLHKGATSRHNKRPKTRKRRSDWKKTDSGKIAEEKYRTSPIGRAKQKRANQRYSFTHYHNCKRGFKALGGLINQYPEIYDKF